MIQFYLEARSVQQGRLIELMVYNGTREGQKIALGLVAFTAEEWHKFRPLIVGGMRAAGLARVPVAFMDQTTHKPT